MNRRSITRRMGKGAKKFPKSMLDQKSPDRRNWKRYRKSQFKTA